MCLAVPGKVLEIEKNPVGMTMGKVSFGGITKTVSLAYLPEVKVGDYVLVHVGFALSTVDEKEAMEVFEYLRQMEDLSELELPSPGSGAGSEEDKKGPTDK